MYLQHTEAVIPDKHINKKICNKPPKTATARTTRSCNGKMKQFN